MALSPGTRLGPYEITAPLGAGGMGEVYTATDTRLDRTVAIKVLPEHVAADPELRQRFEREAKTLAALNHPHICSVYDVGRQVPSTTGARSANGAAHAMARSGDAVDFLVMEYLEGETLAQRLSDVGRVSRSRPAGIPLDQALQIAIQVADALDKAHRKGIVHRDLKPGNIMLTKSGAGASSAPHATLLDFGLAKLRPVGAPGAAALSAAPTVSSPLTGAGAILGTVQYMAPEQLEGQEADARTDLFAFGAVVYEMGTGKKAFEGKSQASLIGAIMHAEPTPLATLQPVTPPALDRLVATCLAKDPDDRWQTARDLLRELQQIATGAPSATETARPRARAWVGWAVAAACFVAAVALAVIVIRQPAPALPQPVRFRIPFPSKTTPGPRSLPALSPDGRRLAFVAVDDASGESRVWVHELDGLDSRPLPGTEGAFGTPFWLADSRTVVFGTARVNVSGELKRIDATGGPALMLANLPSILRSGFQAPDGTLLLGSTGRGVLRVPLAGGTPAPVTSLSEGENSHAFPSLLPDGRHFVYLRARGNNQGGIYVGSIDQSPAENEDRLLLQDGANPAYAPSGEPGRGYALVTRDDVLLALPFDEGTFEAAGEPVPVGQGVGRGTSEPNFALIAGSASGVVAYQEANSLNYRTIEWFDRRGRSLGTVGEPSFYASGTLSLSPTGTSVAASIRDQGRTEIWLFDVERGARSRLISNAGTNWSAVWSPDATAIAFTSSQTAPIGVYRRSLNGGEVRLLGDNSASSDWSRDGRFLLFTRSGDLWLLPDPGTGSGGTPVRLTDAPFIESQARFSPDGRWIAYVTDQSGDPEVYVRAFDPAAPTTSSQTGVQVSTNGGESPRWRADGRELFYRANGQVMAVTLVTEPALKLGTPQTLFPAPRSPGVEEGAWDVAPDGQRFLFHVPVGESAPPPFTVLLNWQSALRR
jgi:serine/threonine protein kinase/Tol biopolymer transport system component